MEWDGYKGGEIASKMAIEAAKKYFDNLNDEKFIALDNNFNVTPIGNSYNLTYQLPEDVETI